MIQKTKLSLNQALEFWELVDQIGKDKRGNLREWAVKNGVPYKFDTVGIDEVCIYFLHDKIVVAIDGSDDDPREWKGNFSPYEKFKNFFKEMFKKNHNYDSENGYHRDYYKAAQLIIEWVDKKLAGDDRPIVWVGHSRGAGIANIAYFENENTENEMVVPFASPRCMLNWRVKQLKKIKKKLNIQAYFIKGDVVDNVPPAMLGWRHFSTFKTRLPRVKGFNHTSIGKSIKKAIGRKNGRNSK